MPLTDAQITIIKATVPILQTGGEALTTHFYKLMFRDFPEVQVFFNQTHQASGEQPRALANSVLCYARNIDALQNLGAVAGQIINKHVALQILPEHYPIVGKCLLQAIREVLGAETATDAVIDAWAAAYGQLADVLIAEEAKVYKSLEEATGGWAGARAFVVSRKVKESDVITSFYLAPADGKAVISYKAGQYIGLQLFVPDTASKCPVAKREIRRNYSLSQAADGKGLRISVKREEGGVASCFLHDTVAEGTSLNVFPPSGQFVLEAKETTAPNALFLCAGVGVTPMMAMLQSIAKDDACTTSIAAAHFVHFTNKASVQAFAKDVSTIADTTKKVTYKFIHTAGTAVSKDETAAVGAVLDSTKAFAVTDAEVYILGPKAFMRALRNGLMKKGVAADKIHIEFFGPTASLE